MYVDPDDADPWGNYMVEHFYKSIGDEAVLNVVGNYSLIPVYGIVGAAVATSVSYGSMFLLQVACARYLGYSPLEDIRPVRLLATVVVAGPVIFGIERALPSNVIALALVPPLGFLVFAVVAVWTGAIDWSELREATSILPAPIGTRVRTFVFDWK
jgi:hypothetical protein